MIEKLIKYSKNEYGVVSNSQINVGDKFVIGQDLNSKPIISEVSEIIEQRKEKGVYSEESRRRMWARVVAN